MFGRTRVSHAGLHQAAAPVSRSITGSSTSRTRKASSRKGFLATACWTSAESSGRPKANAVSCEPGTAASSLALARSRDFCDIDEG